MLKGDELPANQEIVVGGGFEEAEKASSNHNGIIVELGANHEEADTRIILHTMHAFEHGYERALVRCRDTDVLILLIYFLGSIGKQVWMIGGTAKNTKCYPIHEIAMQIPEAVLQSLIGFHALTGCDAVSSFTSYGKKSCWKIFVDHSDLLAGVVTNPLMTDRNPIGIDRPVFVRPYPPTVFVDLMPLLPLGACFRCVLWGLIRIVHGSV